MTTTLLSDIVNDKNKESNTEWVVQVLVDGCNNNNGEEESKQHHAVLDLNNDVNDDARSLLQNSNLSFMQRLGN